MCYRGEHIEGEERLWHNWETSKAFTCQICAQRDATLVCTECPDKDSKNRGGGKGGKRPGGGTPGMPSSADVSGSSGVVLCDNCWERTHAHEDVRYHTRVTVDQWASRAWGGETPAEEEEGSLMLVQAEGAGGGGVAAQNEVMAIVEPTGWGDNDGGDHHGDGGDVAAYEYDYDYSGGAEQYGREPY